MDSLVRGSVLALLQRLRGRVFSSPPSEPPEQTIKRLASEPMSQGARETAIRKLAKEDTLEGMKILAPLLGDPFAHIHEVVIRAIDKTQNAASVQFLAETFLLSAKSAIARANTAKVLGLIGDASAAQWLTRALSDRDLLVRSRSAEALGVLKSTAAVKVLTARLKDAAPPVRYAVALALGRIGDPSAQAALVKQLSDNSWEGRAGALAGLALLDPELVIVPANKMLSDKDYQVRIAALEALLEATRATASRDAAFDGAVKALADKAWQVRAAAITSLVEIWETRSIEPLIEQLDKESGRLKLDVVLALKELTGADMGKTRLAWQGWWESRGEDSELPGERAPTAGRQPAAAGTTAAFVGLPIYTDSMVFILDLSGSMKNPAVRGGTGRKIDIAASELGNTITQLPKESKFNVMVYRYYSQFPPRIEVSTAFKGGIQPAIDGNKKQGQAFLKKQEPLGWGAFFDAIVAAFEDPEVDTIYLLSDGVPSRGTHVNSHEIVDAIVEMNRYRRIVIHTVLTGSVGTDASFMRQLAAATGGLSTVRGADASPPEQVKPRGAPRAPSRVPVRRSSR